MMRIASRGLLAGLTMFGIVWLGLLISPHTLHAQAPLPPKAMTTEMPTLAGTPVPSTRELLGPENAARVAQLARWGKGAVYDATFLPNNQQLAVASATGIYLYAVADLSDVGVFPTNVPVERVAFSPDGRLLASTFSKTIWLWDAKSKKVLRKLEGHTDRINDVSFSPDGRLLASGSEDNTIRLWDAASGALMRTLEGHTTAVFSVAFSPDGRLLASGSVDNTIRLWDAASGALLRTLEGHTFWVSSVAFSPDGRALASGSWDGTVRLWGVR